MNTSSLLVLKKVEHILSKWLICNSLEVFEIQVEKVLFSSSSLDSSVFAWKDIVFSSAFGNSEWVLLWGILILLTALYCTVSVALEHKIPFIPKNRKIKGIRYLINRNFTICKRHGVCVTPICQNYFFFSFGENIIDILLPSKRGNSSALPTSSKPLAKFNNKISPLSLNTIERPTKCT